MDQAQLKASGLVRSCFFISLIHFLAKSGRPLLASPSLSKAQTKTNQKIKTQHNFHQLVFASQHFCHPLLFIPFFPKKMAKRLRHTSGQQRHKGGLRQVRLHQPRLGTRQVPGLCKSIDQSAVGHRAGPEPSSDLKAATPNMSFQSIWSFETCFSLKLQLPPPSSPQLVLLHLVEPFDRTLCVTGLGTGIDHGVARPQRITASCKRQPFLCQGARGHAPQPSATLRPGQARLPASHKTDHFLVEPKRSLAFFSLILYLSTSLGDSDPLSPRSKQYQTNNRCKHLPSSAPITPWRQPQSTSLATGVEK